MVAGLAMLGAAAPGEPARPVPAKPLPQPVRKFQPPKGPFTITAEYAEGAITGVMKYRGNVKLVSDTLEIQGDRLELHQVAKGQYEATVTGAPATLHHAGDKDSPPVTAHATSVHYDTRTAIVDLTGGAELDRGTDMMTGDAIRYDVNARHVSARGLNGGQVKIVIQQPMEKAKEEKARRESEKEAAKKGGDQGKDKDKEQKP